MLHHQVNLITTKEAGEISGYTSDYLARLARSKKISGKRIGHSWLIERESLTRFLDQQGDRKIGYARTLALAREAEYRAHRSAVRRTTKALTKSLQVPRQFATVANSLRSQALALSVALAVVAAGALGARAAAEPRLAQAVAEIANEAASGFNATFGAIPSRIIARIEKAGADMRTPSERLPAGRHGIATNAANASAEAVSSFLADANFSSLQMATDDHRASHITLVSNSPVHVPAAPVAPMTIEDVQAGALTAYAFVTTPSLAADTLARAYVAFGVDAYATIGASFSAYRSLVERAGAETLALAATARDAMPAGRQALATTPRLVDRVNLAFGTTIIETTHAAIRADVATAYGVATAAPASARATFAFVGGMGGAVALATERAPALAIALYQRATGVPATLAPRMAQAVFGAEYRVAARFIALTGSVSGNYLALVEDTGRLAYAGTARSLAFVDAVSVKVRPSQLTAAMHDAYLGTLGKGALALDTIPLLAAALPPLALRSLGEAGLSAGERAALAVYETINSFMRSAQGVFAFFAGSPPTIVLPTPSIKHPALTSAPPRPVSRPAISNSYPTYTTVVQGVSQDSMNQSLAALRADVLSAAAGMVRPVAAQGVTNMNTIQQVNMIQDLSNLIVRNGDFRGGAFSNGSLTSGISVSATTGNFTNLTGGATALSSLTVSGAASLATTTVTGDLAVSGTLTPATVSASNHITAPYFVATSTTATSTFAGSLAIDTNGFVYATSTRNVGIGVLSPAALLALKNATSTQPLFVASNAAGAEVYRITDAGFVGIGTTSPYSKLSVWGADSTSGHRAFEVVNSASTTSFAVDNAGNATTSNNMSVGGSLTVNGLCVAADTRLRRRRRRADGSYEEDEVMIKDIEEGDEVATLDQKTGRITWSRVNGLLDTGIQPLIKIRTLSGKEIRTTAAHPYLVRQPEYRSKVLHEAQKLYRFEVDLSIKIEQDAEDTIVAVANDEYSFTVLLPRKVKQAMRDTMRRCGQPKKGVSALYAMAIVEALARMSGRVHELVIDTDYVGHNDTITSIVHAAFPAIELSFARVGKKSPAHFVAYGVHIKQKTADYAATVEALLRNTESAPLAPSPASPLTSGLGFGDLTRTLSSTDSVFETDEFVKKGKWTTVSELKVGQSIAVAYGTKAAWERVVAIEELPAEQVFDIEVEGTHNFIGNDIVAHNTAVFNQASTTMFTNSGSTWLTGLSAGSLLATDQNKMLISTTSIGISSLGLALSKGNFLVGNDAGVAQATSSIFISSTGNIGIGTTSPYRTLSVAGSGVFTGGDVLASTITATSSITAGSLSLTTALPVSSGGTGWANIQTGAIPYGNGSSALSTTTQGIGGYVLAWSGGVPAWVATSSIQNLTTAFPLSISGLSLSWAGLATTSQPSSSNLFVSNGTNGMYGVATTSATLGLGLSGALTTIGTSQSLSVATSSLYSGTTGQFPYFSGANTLTATSSLFLAASGNLAIGGTGTTTLAGFLDVNGTGANATSTFASNLWVKGTLRTGTGSMYLNDAGLTSSDGNIALSRTATSTFGANGFAIGANQFVVQQTSGNVGIGTTGPNVPLEIYKTNSGISSEFLRLTSSGASGNTGNIIGFYEGGATYNIGKLEVKDDSTGGSYMAFYTLQSGTNSTEKVRIDKSGNVGIGTTSPSSLLSIGGSGTGWNFFDNATTTSYARGIDLKNGGCFAVNGTCVGGGSGSGTVGSGTTGQFPYYAANGTALTATSSIFISSTGNVGIGTSTLNWLLQAAGTRPSLALSDTAAGANLKHWLFSSMGGNLYIGTSTDAYATSTPPALSILNNGNVGIGTTNQLGALDVQQARTETAFSSHVQVLSVTNTQAADTEGLMAGVAFNVINGIANSRAAIALVNTGARADLAFAGTNSGGTATEYMRIQQGGNVGIGTTNPSDFLTVKSTTVNKGITLENSVQAPLITFLDDVANASARNWDLGINRTTFGDFGIRVSGAQGGAPLSGTQVFTILSSGNVGIGTTNPGRALQVDRSAAGSYVARFANTSNAAGDGVLLVNAGPNSADTTSPLIAFYDSSETTLQGTIKRNGAAAVAYNTTSDLRLKENITETTLGLTLLDQIPVYDFNFISDKDKTRIQGFIAQELYKYYPYAVSVGDDLVKNPWGVEYGRLTPLIVKSVQELHQRTKGIGASGQGDVIINGNVGIGTTTPYSKLTVWGADTGANIMANFVNSASTSVMSILNNGNVGIGTNTPNTALEVKGVVGADGFVVNAAPAASFPSTGLGAGTLGSTTLTAEMPAAVLTAAGNVDLYKLATYSLAGLQALADKVGAMDMRLASLEDRMAKLESGAVGTATTSPFSLSATSLASALQGFGVLISKGFAQFAKIAADNLQVGSPARPTGITMYDKATGQPYCFQIGNGAATTTPGECADIAVANAPTTSTTVSTGSTTSTSLETSTLTTGSSPQATTTTTASTTDAGTTASTTVSTSSTMLTTGSSPQATTTTSGGDVTPPVVTLTGAAALQITVGDAFTDPGATALDNVDGNLTAKIVVTGSVNTSVAGLYQLTYSATDTAGNTGSVSRVVTVAAPPPAPADMPPANSGADTGKVTS